MADLQCEMETFVIIHSQELLLECERQGHFSELSSYRYLFVGAGDISKIRAFGNVIVARELPDNIEGYPNLLSFTGWYAIVKNNLSRAPWVSLLEYDVRLDSDFSSKTLTALQAGCGVVGYVPYRLSHPMYLHASPWLITSLLDIYGIDLPQLIYRYLDNGGVDRWNATTNASLSRVELEKFVAWFLPLSRLFHHDPIGAHVHERALPIFCMLNGIENHLLPDVLEHQQQRSHRILALSQDEARIEAEKTWFGTWIRNHR